MGGGIGFTMKGREGIDRKKGVIRWAEKRGAAQQGNVEIVALLMNWKRVTVATAVILLSKEAVRRGDREGGSHHIGRYWD
jgi:hypothetical protein